MPAYIPSFGMLHLGLLIARLVLGLGLAAHGAQKLFGWFGGAGLAGTANFLESAGFYPGRQMARMAGLGEFVGGLLTALGLFGPIGPAIMLAVMLVAMSQNLGHGFFATDGGIEVALLYCAGGLVLATTGPGAYSLDGLLGLSFFETAELTAVVLIVALIGAGVVLGRRSRGPAASARR
ncbi:MAG TPA: DoxX family protein [Gemmatimonadales bacterium]|nr:DoxX family protein [Gemmatimonadales bacterium]